MNTLKERMVKARKEKGLSQEALAKAVGKSQSAIAAVESGRNKETSGLITIARVLGVRPEWLETGEGAMHPVETEAPAFDNNVNLSLKHALHKIPILSWVQAGNWREIELSPDLEYIEITTPVRDGYGLRVQGDSMMPEFVQGDIIVVSPHAQPENGSYVVVVQEGNKATFKKLVYDGAKPYFKPLNPQYPMLEANEQTSIVGVVKQKIKTY